MQIHYYDEEQKEIEPQEAKPKEKFWDKIKNRFKKNPKLKWKVPVIAIVALIIVFTAWAAIRRYRGGEGEEGQPLIKIIKDKLGPEEKKIQSKLDGTMASEKTANRHPLTVVIENHTDARPQWGLAEASIIYEAIAEGGITRFLAVYGPNGANKVGPVRSARTYFLEWTLEYDGFFAHVGGNADALDAIPGLGIKNLDQFSLGERAYWRENLPKATEHTMFADTDKLWKVAEDQGWDIGSSDFIAYKFKKDEVKNLSDKKQVVTIDFSTPSYQVKWEYNPEGNNYKRVLAGLPHKDGKSGRQLEAKNIAIQEVARTPVVTKIGENGWKFKTVGEGKAKITRDGETIEGVWKKRDQKSRTMFYNKDGEEIEFNPGVTWIEVVHPDINVTIN